MFIADHTVESSDEVLQLDGDPRILTLSGRIQGACSAPIVTVLVGHRVRSRQRPDDIATTFGGSIRMIAFLASHQGDDPGFPRASHARIATTGSASPHV
jgi:hypothetical protein